MTQASSDATTPTVEATPRQRVAWMLYDWANSGYGLVWGSIFPQVFIRSLLPEQSTWEPRIVDGKTEPATGLVVLGIDVPGSSVFAVFVAMVALLTVLSAPVLGALADARGWQKRLFITTATAGSCVAMLQVLVPVDSAYGWQLAMGIYCVSLYFFGLSIAFYNAFLPVLAGSMGENKLGGWGFAVGYIGGAIMLIIAGLVLPAVLPDFENRFNLGLGLSGLWWLLFSLPAFLLLPKVPPASDAHLRPKGVFGPFKQVAGTLRHLRSYRMLFLFLLAFLVYINGVESVINLASAFASDVLMMNVPQLTVMYLVVQFVAFAGAATCGYAAERFGNKPVITTTLLAWCAGVGLTYFVQTPTQFTLLGVLIGLVLGGVQSSSRNLMSKLAPSHIRNEAFGFYAIGTKAMSIFGPLLFAGVGILAGPRFAVFAVLPFLIVGLILLQFVREPKPAVA
ncbi:MAG: MFS transporter [Planctomycetota bacterium]